MIRQCIVCGHAFNATAPARKCCSIYCSEKRHQQQRRHRNPRVTRRKNKIHGLTGVDPNHHRNCVVCDESFSSTRGGRLTCSIECAAALKVKRRRDRLSEFSNCVNCGLAFKKGEGASLTLCSTKCTMLELQKKTLRYQERASRYSAAYYIAVKKPRRLRERNQ